MSVVGFDLGSLNSVVAVARRRVIDVLQNATGHRVTPSMIGFNGKQRAMGNDALQQYSNNYRNTIFSMNRFLGRKFDDPEVKEEQKFAAFKLAPTPDGRVGFEVSYNDEQQVIPVELAIAALLTELKAVAERGLDGTRVVDCVLSVPPMFTHVQRAALLDAARLAGLNVLRLMNESTAVALNYGILRPLQESQITVLFVDMGDASTKVSAVNFEKGRLTVKATGCDDRLGVRNFVQLLVEHFIKDVQERYKMDVSTNAKSMIKLRKECVRIVKVLSANTSSPFNVEYLMNETDVSGMVQRDDFEAMAKTTLLPRLQAVLKRVLGDAGVDPSALHSVECVGGGVRIPMVQQTIKETLGKPLSFTCDGDESVARGCALQCAMLSPSFRVRDFDVVDCTPYAVDVQWGKAGDDLNALAVEDKLTLFQAHNTVPSVKMLTFKDKRDPVQINIEYTDPSALPAGMSPHIGKYVISGIPKEAPPNAVNVPKMKIRIKADMHGMTRVKSASWVQEIEVEPEPEPEPEKPAPMETDTPTAAAADAKPDADATAPPADAADAPAAMDTSDTPDADANADATVDSKDNNADMETDDATNEPKKQKIEDTSDAVKEPKKKKKKISKVRTELKVSAYDNGFYNSHDFNTLLERESAMANQDRVIRETNDRRNELEAYVLEMRSAVQDSLKDFINDATRGEFVKKCDDMEDWLYEDGFDAQKSEYVKKLKELQVIGDPVKGRKYEAEHRQEYVSQLKSTIVKYQMEVESKDEKYSHITAEEKDTVKKHCGDADQWLLDNLQKQDKLPLSEPPAVTCVQLDNKRRELEAAASKIMNKKKPPPPKPKEEKKDAKTDAKAGDAAPMDTDDKADAKTADTPMTDATADAPAADATADSGKAADAATADTNMDVEQLD